MEDWVWVVVVAAGVVAMSWYLHKTRTQPVAVYKLSVGGITLETLAQYSGYDYSKPILVAIKGKIYDVTKAAEQFAPGKVMHAYAGKEISRALAKDSTSEAVVGSDVLHDLDQAAADKLEAAIADFAMRYDLVGEVVAPKELTLAELAQHDGVKVPGAPLYLAIQGKVFDVSRGSAFYGPDGVYPFAGRECARALALMSTELSDCNDKVDDLGYVEREALREWTGKFTYKYPIVGRIVAASAAPTAGATGTAASADSTPAAAVQAEGQSVTAAKTD